MLLQFPALIGSKFLALQHPRPVRLGIVHQRPQVQPVLVPGPVGDEAMLDPEVGVLGRHDGVPHAVVRDGRVGVGLVDPGVDALLLVEREEELRHLRRGLPGRLPVGHLGLELYDLGDPPVRIRGQARVLCAEAAGAGEVPRVVEAI